MALTQARAFGAHSGRRYGSFADKATNAHPVGTLTQARAFGAHSGARYGSFSGKAADTSHPVGRLTQLRAFGAFSGGRFGSFAGRSAAPGQPPSGGGVGLGVRRRVPVPPQVVDLMRQNLMDEDELMLMIAARVLLH